MTGLRIDVAAVAEMFRGVPADELDAAIRFFEAGSRDLGRPLGRGLASFAALRSLELMREGVDPADTLRVFDAALQLHGTPAASEMAIEQRLAALPRKREQE